MLVKGSSHYIVELTVKASTTIVEGDLVENSGGKAIPATKKENAVLVGIATHGAKAGEKVRVRSGCVFGFKNAASGGVTATEIGGSAYISDAQTVIKSDSGNTAIGKVKSLEDGKVWVYVE